MTTNDVNTTPSTSGAATVTNHSTTINNTNTNVTDATTDITISSTTNSNNNIEEQQQYDFETELGLLKKKSRLEHLDIAVNTDIHNTSSISNNNHNNVTGAASNISSSISSQQIVSSNINIGTSVGNDELISTSSLVPMISTLNTKNSTSSNNNDKNNNNNSSNNNSTTILPEEKSMNDRVPTNKNENNNNKDELPTTATTNITNGIVKCSTQGVYTDIKESSPSTNTITASSSSAATNVTTNNAIIKKDKKTIHVIPTVCPAPNIESLWLLFQRTEFVCSTLQFSDDIRELYKNPTTELIQAKKVHDEDLVRKLEIEYLSKKPNVRVRLLFILEFMCIWLALHDEHEVAEWLRWELAALDQGSNIQANETSFQKSAIVHCLMTKSPFNSLDISDILKEHDRTFAAKLLRGNGILSDCVFTLLSGIFPPESNKYILRGCPTKSSIPTPPFIVTVLPIASKELVLSNKDDRINFNTLIPIEMRDDNNISTTNNSTTVKTQETTTENPQDIAVTVKTQETNTTQKALGSTIVVPAIAAVVVDTVTQTSTNTNDNINTNAIGSTNTEPLESTSSNNIENTSTSTLKSSITPGTSNLVHFCAWCGNSNKQKLKKCSKCNYVSYCCREHQVKDWHGIHKLECQHGANINEYYKNIFLTHYDFSDNSVKPRTAAAEEMVSKNPMPTNSPLPTVQSRSAVTVNTTMTNRNSISVSISGSVSVVQSINDSNNNSNNISNTSNSNNSFSNISSSSSSSASTYDKNKYIKLNIKSKNNSISTAFHGSSMSSALAAIDNRVEELIEAMTLNIPPSSSSGQNSKSMNNNKNNKQMDDFITITSSCSNNENDDDDDDKINLNDKNITNSNKKNKNKKKKKKSNTTNNTNNDSISNSSHVSSNDDLANLLSTSIISNQLPNTSIITEHISSNSTNSFTIQTTTQPITSSG